jgi:hypothetical protein
MGENFGPSPGAILNSGFIVECNSDCSQYMQTHQRADKDNFQNDSIPQG